MNDAATDGRITSEADGRILRIGIDRPAKLNGFTPKMQAELAAAYTELEHNDDYWCGLLFAHGDHFTAGLDLAKMAPLLEAGEREWSADQVDPLDRYPPRRTKPMVAAVKGITFTIGIELMLAADVVVAADDCRFSQLEVKRGIMAAGGATIRMVERAGWGNAMLYLLTGDEFDAATALRLGFVQQVVPAGQELDRATEIAGRIVEQAPLAVRATLLNARRAVDEGPAAAIAEFDPVNRRLFESNDTKEGVASFVERRKANFTGT